MCFERALSEVGDRRRSTVSRVSRFLSTGPVKSHNTGFTEAIRPQSQLVQLAPKTHSARTNIQRSISASNVVARSSATMRDRIGSLAGSACLLLLLLFCSSAGASAEDIKGGYKTGEESSQLRTRGLSSFAYVKASPGAGSPKRVSQAEKLPVGLTWVL